MVLAPGAFRLKLRTDGLALAPPNRPGALADESIRVDFGLSDRFVLLVRPAPPADVFAPEPLRLIRDLSDALHAMDPGATVLSLATERDDRVTPGTMEFRSILDPLPESDDESHRLREHVRELALYSGTLVSTDETAAAILVDASTHLPRADQIERIRGVIAAQDLAGATVDVIGPPVAEALLGFHILEDLGIHAWRTRSADASPRTSLRSLDLRTMVARKVGLLPLSLFLLAATFWIAFRSMPGVILPLCKAGACLASVLGLMGWLGVPIYLTIAVMPVILTAIGVTDEIHVFSRYAQIRRERPDIDSRSAVRTTMDELTRPIVKTAITTAIGFFSFAGSTIEPVRVFGIFTGLGVLLSLLWSLTVTPASLALLSPRSFRIPNFLGSSAFVPLAAFLSRRRRLVLILSILLVASTPLGIRRLEVQDSWIAGFSPQSTFFRATEFFNDRFFGAHLIWVRVRAAHEPIQVRIAARRLEDSSIRLPGGLLERPELLGGCAVQLRKNADASWSSVVESATRFGEETVLTLSDPIGPAQFLLGLQESDSIDVEIAVRPGLSPDALLRVQRLEEFIRSREERRVGGVLGPAEFLSTTNYIVAGRMESARHIPLDVEGTHLLWEHYSWIRGPLRLREVVSPDFGSCLVTVFLKDANYADTARLLNDIRDYERENLKGAGLRLDFGGDVAVSQDLIDAIVTTQIRSLLFSLVGILVVLTILNRSVRWGFLGMLPCAVAVAVNMAFMGWMGIPLGVATSMFAAMALGIGDAFSIHLIERYRAELAGGTAHQIALREALRVAGPAILVDAASVAFGFGILMLSQVPANARLGGTTLVTVVTCLVATLLVLPAFLPRTLQARPTRGR